MSAPLVADLAGRSPVVDWSAELARLAADPTVLQLVFQPIVDVARGVVAGYETLARFRAADGGPSPATPDRWFAAADAAGAGARVEALVVERCLALRGDLPPNCFLTVNVSPHLLTEPELADLLLSAGDLTPLVLELTEHQDVADLRPLLDVQDKLRDRGALMALDDAGSGYSGLQQLTAVRPQLIKLDRALVDGADRDPVKLALAQLLGEFGDRMDAWLLAEGVETWGEMEAFSRLGVPLAQGYLLGRPAPPWSTLDPAVAARLREVHARGQLRENVVSLVERVELVPADGAPTTTGTAVQVDAHGHPVALLLPLRRDRDPAGHRVAPVSLRVSASAGTAEVARRVATRPEETRFDPVVCVDDVGAVVGVVRVDHLLARLAEQHEQRPA
jgi:EAL domain-containing protein (putative c-di-GMP-specific phosphodiesterase class I)/antitoxin (DNA-binding transcriptional repressor) of toxin-antitoxin stability system